MSLSLSSHHQWRNLAHKEVNLICPMINKIWCMFSIWLSFGSDPKSHWLWMKHDLAVLFENEKVKCHGWNVKIVRHSCAGVSAVSSYNIRKIANFINKYICQHCHFHFDDIGQISACWSIQTCASYPYYSHSSTCMPLAPYPVKVVWLQNMHSRLAAAARNNTLHTLNYYF